MLVKIHSCWHSDRSTALGEDRGRNTFFPNLQLPCKFWETSILFIQETPVNFPPSWFRTYVGKFVSCAPQTLNIWKANKGNAKYISINFFNVVIFLNQYNVYRGGTEPFHNFQEFAFTLIFSYTARYYFCPGILRHKHFDLNNL